MLTRFFRIYILQRGGRVHLSSALIEAYSWY